MANKSGLEGIIDSVGSLLGKTDKALNKGGKILETADEKFGVTTVRTKKSTGNERSITRNEVGTLRNNIDKAELEAELKDTKAALSNRHGNDDSKRERGGKTDRERYDEYLENYDRNNGGNPEHNSRRPSEEYERGELSGDNVARQYPQVSLNTQERYDMERENREEESLPSGARPNGRLDHKEMREMITDLISSGDLSKQELSNFADDLEAYFDPSGKSEAIHSTARLAAHVQSYVVDKHGAGGKEIINRLEKGESGVLLKIMQDTSDFSKDLEGSPDDVSRGEKWINDEYGQMFRDQQIAARDQNRAGTPERDTDNAPRGKDTEQNMSGDAKNTNGKGNNNKKDGKDDAEPKMTAEEKQEMMAERKERYEGVESKINSQTAKDILAKMSGDEKEALMKNLTQTGIHNEGRPESESLRHYLDDKAKDHYLGDKAEENADLPETLKHLEKGGKADNAIAEILETAEQDAQSGWVNRDARKALQTSGMKADLMDNPALYDPRVDKITINGEEIDKQTAINQLENGPVKELITKKLEAAKKEYAETGKLPDHIAVQESRDARATNEAEARLKYEKSQETAKEGEVTDKTAELEKANGGVEGTRTAKDIKDAIAKIEADENVVLTAEQEKALQAIKNLENDSVAMNNLAKKVNQPGSTSFRQSINDGDWGTVAKGLVDIDGQELDAKKDVPNVEKPKISTTAASTQALKDALNAGDDKTSPDTAASTKAESPSVSFSTDPAIMEAVQKGNLEWGSGKDMDIKISNTDFNIDTIPSSAMNTPEATASTEKETPVRGG